MPCPSHPLALFSLVLVCRNKQAKYTVAYPDNIYYVSILSNSREALDVGFHICGKSSTTLAILGQGIKADIYIERSSIAKVQCSFEIDLDTGVVIFYNRSHSCTTQISGENTILFKYRCIWKVLVQKDLNTIIGISSKGRNLVQFELE